MYTVPEELKLNAFKHIEIPSPARLAARNGFLEVPATQYSGDVMMQVVSDKIETIQNGLELYEQYAKEEAEKAAESE